MVRIEEIRQEVKRALDEERIKYFIGYRSGTHAHQAAPVFIRKGTDVNELIWDPTCVHNLVRFLIDEKKKKQTDRQPDLRPVGLMVKGCDSRAVNVLLQELYIKREDVFLVGVSCENGGMADMRKAAEKTGPEEILAVEFAGAGLARVKTGRGVKEFPLQDLLVDRCRACPARYPVVSDVVFGDKVERQQQAPDEKVKQWEAKSAADRFKFWKSQFDRCIRCYACRSICPMCYCEECVVDSIQLAVSPQTTADQKAQRIRWLEKSPSVSENFVYHLTRALHLAGRCIDCGECERACPVGIPLRLLNKKMEQEAKNQYGYEAGFAADGPALVSCFNEQDPEGFIR